MSVTDSLEGAVPDQLASFLFCHCLVYRGCTYQAAAAAAHCPSTYLSAGVLLLNFACTAGVQSAQLGYGQE